MDEQRPDTGSFEDSRGHRERLRWRPWPCPSCSGGQTALGHLGASTGAGGKFLEAEWEERTAAQIDSLREWTNTCPHTVEQELWFPRLAEGSEHRVFFHGADETVYKQTLPGTFGDTYELINNRIHQRRCSPYDYLDRLRLWQKAFGWAPRDLGLTQEGQVVSVQEFIKGRIPSQEEVDEYLVSIGLEDVKKQCFVWKKLVDGEEVWIGDTRDENFVVSEDQMVPIDVRLWLA